MAAPLVTAAHAGGTAGVVRRHGVLLLTEDVDGGGGVVLDGDRPAVVGVGPGTVAQGGRLPAGATGAEVVDELGRRHRAAVGGGAWIVVLPRGLPGDVGPTRFHDEAGRSVARRLPERWSREPVADAPAPCPACGATAWDLVRPDEEVWGARGRQDGAMEPTPAVVCRACGHEEVVGMVSQPTSDDVPDDDPEDDAPWPGPADVRAALARLEVPVLAVAGRPARAAGWGGAPGGPLTSFVVRDGDDAGWTVQVGVERRPPPLEDAAELARSGLEQALWDGVGDEVSASEAGFALWVRTRMREHRATAAGAPLRRLALTIDGAPAQAALVEAAERWAAVGREGDLVVTVVGRGPRPRGLALERLADPAASLLGEGST